MEEAGCRMETNAKREEETNEWGNVVSHGLQPLTLLYLCQGDMVQWLSYFSEQPVTIARAGSNRRCRSGCWLSGNKNMLTPD